MAKENLFVISVDTEEDYAFYDSKNHNTTVDNVSELNRFQYLCEEYHFKPTYLCTYQVAKNDVSRDCLLSFLKKENCEIGTHFHPWLTPPNQEIKPGKNFVSNDYSDKILKLKFSNLHNLIVERFGIVPKSFRSGRWVMNKAQFKLLLDYDYKIDTSVLPYIDYSKISKIQCNQSDYRYVDNYQYYNVNVETFPYKSEKGIIEIPVTSKLFFLGLPFSYLEFCKKNIPKFENIFCWRTFKFGEISITPGNIIKNFDKIKYIIKKSDRQSINIINFAVHSTELSKGWHPDFKTEDEIELFFKNIDKLFNLLRDRGFRGVGLNSLYKILEDLDAK
jgi:hypothetical protein